MPTSAPLVLVADDEPSMLELVARHLRTMNEPKLEVIQASDGEDAWRLAREHLPDLVVLDVMMPGMSGWEVCRKIREDVALAHTGVVMLTGIGENLNQMTSPLYGADQYIDKPFEFDDFDDKVRATLRAREKQRLGVTRPSINGTAGAAKPVVAKERPTSKRAAAAKKSKPAAVGSTRSRATATPDVRSDDAKKAKKKSAQKKKAPAKAMAKATKTAAKTKPAPKAKKAATKARGPKSTGKAGKSAKRRGR
jgi:DNA-binding response OmpR family regulator